MFFASFTNPFIFLYFMYFIQTEYDLSCQNNFWQFQEYHLGVTSSTLGVTETPKEIPFRNEKG